MDRDAIWALMGVGLVCWIFGGAGPKWARRWVWPIVIVGLAGWFGISWPMSLGAGIGLIVSHHLGYSPQRKSIVVRVATGLFFGYALTPLLYPHWGMMVFSGLLTSLVFNGGMALSQRYNWVTWKWIEGATGAVQGGLVAWRLLQ